jgi:hypothetical protein
MTDDDKTNEEDEGREDEEGEHEEEKKETPKEQVKEDLGEKVTLEHMKSLQEHYDAQITELRRDHSKDAEERQALIERIEKQEELIKNMIKEREEKDKVTDSSTTIVVPPGHLDPPQRNPDTPESQEARGEEPAKKRGWKGLF